MKTKVKTSPIFPKKSTKKAYSCRLSVDAIALIDQAAKENNISRSSVIDGCVKFLLSENSKKKLTA